MLVQILPVFLIVFSKFNCYATPPSYSQNGPLLSVVNITIDATVDQYGKWESKVDVDNSHNSFPKHIINISHHVNASGITFLSHIDDIYQLHLTCSQDKKIDLIEKLSNNYIYKPNFGFYKYHEVASTWHNAWKTCLNENAYLAIINSEQESKMVATLISPLKPIPGVADYANHYVNIGFHDLFSEGQYYTIHGKPLAESGFLKWGAGQPDNAGNNENCGSLHRSGVLNDIGCTLPVSFICERDLN